MSPKTIFITSFHGLVSRALLSGIIDYLISSNNIRVIIFVPDFKKDYFVKVFGTMPNVVIEGVSPALPLRAFFFQKLSYMLLDTPTMSLIRRSYRGYRHHLLGRLYGEAVAFLGKWRAVRELFRAINYCVSSTSKFSSYIAKYRPALVFATDIKHILDSQLLLEAKKSGVKTVGMVRSWDYITAKGMVRVKPDTLIVHNDILKKEAYQLIDMKEEDILVTGIPHFDAYVNEVRTARDIFMKNRGIPLSSRMILLAPVGDKFGDTDKQIFEILCEAFTKKELPDDVFILVRLPPGDTVDIRGFTPCEHIVFDYPGTTFKDHHRKSNEMSFSDLLHLADSLYHSELVVSGPSTMCIDAAVFDKPVVFLGFEGKVTKDYFDSFVHIYDYDHMKNAIRTGGTRMAKSGKELIEFINMYLKHPEREKEERRRIVQEQCFKMDGHSSKRVADRLLSLLEA